MKHEIQYYLDLKYPTTFIEKEGGFWVWHPDLGSGSVFGFGETLEEAIDELNEARKATFEYLFEKTCLSRCQVMKMRM